MPSNTATRRQDITLFRGDDQMIRLTADRNGSVAGWTLKLILRRTHSSPDIALEVDGFVDDPGSASTPGVLGLILTQAGLLTLERRKYVYSIKRTNPGAADTLKEGAANIRPDVMHAL